MRFRRIKNPDITAHFLERPIDLLEAPEWVKRCIYTDIKNKCTTQTNSGRVELNFPIWLVREANENGAYPVSSEYMGKNFKKIEEGEAPTDTIESLRKRKDAAYLERNKLVVAFAEICQHQGCKVRRTKHIIKPGEKWDSDWLNILFVETPAGQASWHFHDSQFDLIAHFEFQENYPWDEHSTELKYYRLGQITASLF